MGSFYLHGFAPYGKFKLQTSVGLVFNNYRFFFIFKKIIKFRTKELSVLGIFIITKLEVLMKD